MCSPRCLCSNGTAVPHRSDVCALLCPVWLQPPWWAAGLIARRPLLRAHVCLASTHAWLHVRGLVPVLMTLRKGSSPVLWTRCEGSSWYAWGGFRRRSDTPRCCSSPRAGQHPGGGSVVHGFLSVAVGSAEGVPDLCARIHCIAVGCFADNAMHQVGHFVPPFCLLCSSCTGGRAPRAACRQGFVVAVLPVGHYFSQARGVCKCLCPVTPCAKGWVFAPTLWGGCKTPLPVHRSAAVYCCTHQLPESLGPGGGCPPCCH